MKIGKVVQRVGWVCVLRLLLGLWLATCSVASAAEVKLSELKTRSGTFTNVVVTSLSKTDLMIRHDRGIGNVKISDIEDDAALIALGLKTLPTAEELSRTNASALMNMFSPTNETIRVMMEHPAWSRLEELREVKWTWQLLAGIGTAAFAIYLFGCYCMKLICEKAATQPGPLIWIPILQMIPMFRAAGMSGWWLLACLIPLLNFVAMILWSFKIVKARGKNVLWAIVLLLPALNLIAILYLAFSGTPEPEGKISTSR